MTAPLSYTVPTAAAATGLSRERIKTAIRAGDLRAKKSSRDKDGNPVGSYVILAGALQAWLDSLEDA